MTPVFLFVAALAECKLSVQAGASKGTATLLTRMLADGAKYVRVDLRLVQPSGKKVSIIQESTYSTDGRPRHKSQTTTLPGGADQVMTVSFEPTFVRYSVRSGTDTVESKIAYPAGTYLATPEFWVVRDKPKLNKSVTYFRFDLAEHAWVSTRCVYKGKETVKVGKVSRTAHKVEMGEVTSWLDDYGDPVRVETKGTLMQRV